MRSLLAIALVGATAFAAPVPKELKRSPRDRLQGQWVIVSLDTSAGQQVQTDVFAGVTLTFEGDKLSTATPGGAGYKNETAIFDFDALPMRIDIKTETSTTKGIFKFEDGQLHWCHTGQSKPAPTEFKGGAGNYCFIWIRPAK